MHLLVLGASGGIGRWLVRLAAEAGHTIRALVRPSTLYDAPAGVQVIRGEVLAPGTLDGAARGVDAIACCLGQRRAGRSPWSAALSPPDLMERVMAALLPAARAAAVQRVVVVSAAGVGDSRMALTAPVAWMVRQGRIGTAYRDLEAMERRLETEGPDWLALRPVTLADGAPNGGARPVDRYSLFSSVRRADVAVAMLAALTDPAPLGRRAVMLGS